MKRISYSKLICGTALAVVIGAAQPGSAQEPEVQAVLTNPVILESAGDSWNGTTIWGNAEYLLWWAKGAPTPPLVTSGPLDPTTPGVAPGILGAPGTSIVLGGTNQHLGGLSGGRFTVGGWIDTDDSVGVETNYLFLGSQVSTRTVTSPGVPALSVPFINALTGKESTVAVANPFGYTNGAGVFIAGAFPGVAALTIATALQGSELNGVVNLGNGDGLRLDLLGGFRWLQLDEKLSFVTNSSTPGFPFASFDEFKTRNNFYGGQLALRGEVDRGNFFVQATGKLALGEVHETIQIDGSVASNGVPGFPALTTFPGGYFSGPGNSGSFHRDRFAVLPEVNLTVGYQLTSAARLYAGYSFMYISDVARPGDQIDRVINPANSVAISVLPSAGTPPLRPAFLGKDTDFWVQGLNFGVELGF